MALRIESITERVGALVMRRDGDDAALDEAGQFRVERTSRQFVTHLPRRVLPGHRPRESALQRAETGGHLPALDPIDAMERIDRKSVEATPFTTGVVEMGVAQDGKEGKRGKPAAPAEG